MIDNNLQIDELKKQIVKRLEEKVSFKSVNYNVKEFFSLCVFKLIKEDKFYGNFLLLMERQMNLLMTAPAAVSFKSTIGTGRGGFILHINPYRILGYTTNEVMAILVHEIDHIIHRHLFRAKAYPNVDKTYLNIAMDLSINQLNPKKLPDGCISFATFKDDFNIPHHVNVEPLREFDYYLKILLDNRDSVEQSDFMKNIRSREKGMYVPLDGDGNEKGGKGNGEDQSVTTDGEGFGNHDAWEESSFMGDEDEANEMVKRMIEDAGSKSRGTYPSHVQRILEQLRKKKQISWQNELRRYNASMKCPFKKTPIRRDRRQPRRLDIDGRMPDRKRVIWFAIDESGSFSDKEVMTALSEAYNIVKDSKTQIYIVKCDTKVQKVYKVNTAKDIDFTRDACGGTAFSPVIEHINATKMKVDLLVYFTDGYGERTLTEKPKGYPILWVLTDPQYQLSVQKHYGRVRRLRKQ